MQDQVSPTSSSADSTEIWSSWDRRPAECTPEGSSTPPLSNIEKHWEAIWMDALSVCKKTLCEEDYAVVFQFNSCEALMENLQVMHETYTRESFPSILRKLKPLLDPTLKRVTHAIALCMRSHHIRTGIIWGLVNLLLDAASAFDTALSQIIEMIETIIRGLEIIHIYLPSHSVSIEDQNCLVVLFVDVISFWSLAVTQLRRESIESLLLEAWSRFAETDLAKISTKIKNNIQHLKEKSQALAIRQSGQDRSQTSIINDVVRLAREENSVHPSERNLAQPSGKLPCHYISLDEYPNLFPRDDISRKIREDLDPKPTNIALQSCLLCGIGGAGKTQLALAYAYEWKSRGMQATFWLNCETPLELSQSFTEIAVALNLEGAASVGKNDANKFLVIQWLKTTDVHWLMVFDNVEDFNLLRDNWPVSSCGSILVTSRHDNSDVTDLIPKQIPVAELGLEEGARFLLDLVYLDNTLTDSERKSESQFAADLLSEIGGLPLTLTTTARQVRRRSTSVEKFLPLYQTNASRVHMEGRVLSHKPFYKHSVSTVWDMPFKSLDDNATVLIGVASVLAPVDIPIALFQPNSFTDLPPCLEFCGDMWKFDIALTDLLKNSLIGRDSRTGLMSVHRTIQMEFRQRMNQVELLDFFDTAARLLLASFPKLVNGVSLRTRWPVCNQYINHVLTLSKRIQEHGLTDPTQTKFENFVECASSAVWYLLETGEWVVCLELLNIALRLCKKDSLIHANLLNTKGGVENKRNHSKEAYAAFFESRRIRETLLPKDHEEIANTYNNLGNVYQSDCKYEEALDLHQKALAIDMTKAVEEQNKIVHIRYLNIGNTYAFQGKCSEAREYIEKGRRHAIEMFGAQTHYDAVADWSLARIDYAEGNYRVAREKYQRAFEIQEKGNPMSPLTSAAAYKLACVAIREGKLEEASNLLQRTLLIAQFNEARKGDKGEIARVIRKLATIYYLRGDNGNGDTLLAKAEVVRKKLQPELLNEENSYDLLVSSFYR
ncbi:hypothetical protein BP5796_09804 [Coleophoma crateriformis]|uniref:DUF7779 domain-containing protein n=1 Tax=Coleophoma crateriformis TaxID=565419 RepID=A0A3D8QZ76_9HELO|nr:hypothetical protein BP5796_09804 [Coleophoma crateriformis]